MKYQIAVVVFRLVCFVLANPAKVEDQVWKSLQKSEVTNVKITFRRAYTDLVWNRFHRLKLSSREAILTTQHFMLKEHADVVQADVVNMLSEKRSGKMHYLDQLWITNELIVREVDRDMVEQLRDHPDVESLIAEQFIELEQTEEGESFDYKCHGRKTQWGVVNVQAPAAWARGITGTGIVIGSIDSGVRHTHERLAPTYRGNNAGENHNYNWRAPSGNDAIPSDASASGHGTHTIGIHSGARGIGVAPDSRWIACRGCANDFCSTFDLESCGNFMACPTNTTGGDAQCTRAPHIVNNSWGGGSDTWFDAILSAWSNAEISGVFAIGNSGPECRTSIYPGNHILAFGVGSITSINTLSSFSSLGPGELDSVKPDVVAPGQDIVSASHSSDTGLRTKSGTSMASPHVAGAVALVLHARRGSGYNAHRRLIETALAHKSFSSRTCGDRPEGSRPNYHAGHGRIDANAAAQT